MAPGGFVTGKPTQSDLAYGGEALQKLDLYAPGGGNATPAAGSAAPSRRC